MRSVTTYPPTAFPAPSTTPIKPMTRTGVVSAVASATIAPTKTIPCTKFDPDMSGACRMDGHAGNDFVAGRRRQHEYIERYDTVDHIYCPSTVLRVASCLIWPSCVSTAPANTSSFQSMASPPPASAGFNKWNRLREYISLA